MRCTYAVVGPEEEAHGTVNVRTRDNVRHGECSVADLLAKFERLRRDRVDDAATGDAADERNGGGGGDEAS